MKPRLAFCSPGHLQSLAHINDPVSPHSSVWNESWSADFSGWTVPPSGAANLSRVQASPLQYGFHPALSNESLSTPAYYSSDSGSGIPTTEQLKINQILEIYTIPICFFLFFFGASGKEPICKCRRHKKTGFSPWGGKIPWRRAWQPTPLFLPGESHGQRTSWATVHRITKSQTRLKGLSTAYTDMHSLWLESFPRKWRKEDYATNLRLGDCDCIKEGGKGERTWFSKKWDLRDSSSGWKWRSLLVSWVLRNKWDGIRNIRKPCGFIYQNFISFFLPVLSRFNYLNIIEH